MAIILTCPLAIFTVAPVPCLIVMICDPDVAFSIIHTLDTVFGAKVIVRVAVRFVLDVILRYKDLAPSEAPSAIVIVVFASPIASVP